VFPAIGNLETMRLPGEIILSVTPPFEVYILTEPSRIEVSEISGFEELDDCSWQGVYILNRCYNQFISTYPKEEETFA
jgi:hypothetical protein